MSETVLTNARLVLPDGLLDGTVVLRDGRIAEVAAGRTHAAGAVDLDGDTLIPGIVDLHTDNLERQVLPRPGARFPSAQALLAHDAHCVAAGVTTVLDALCVGDLQLDQEDRSRTCRDGVADIDALGALGLLRVHHLLHLRCELPAEGMIAQLDRYAAHPRVQMASLMDHTPGFGQFAGLEAYRARLRRGGVPVAEIEARIARLESQRARNYAPQRRAMLERLPGVVLASHDDALPDEVARNVDDGIAVAEFPVNAEAARAARAHGQHVVVGAPNYVRGGSHSGNVAAAALLEAGLVDAFASDYVPASLLAAAFAAAAGLGLPQAVALITSRPARMVGLPDRGAIAPALRADLVRVRVAGALASPVAVWREGARIG